MAQAPVVVPVPIGNAFKRVASTWLVVFTDKVIHLFPNDWVKVHRQTVKIPIAPKSESAPNIVAHESVQLRRELRARGARRQRVVLSSIMETGACSHTQR